MKIICSWCGKLIGRKEPYRDQSDTHGKCPECLHKQASEDTTSRGEAEFNADLLEIYNEQKKAGCNTTMLLRLIRKHGGYGAAQVLLKTPRVTSGLLKIAERGKLDEISLEALALNPKWTGLIKHQQREVAQKNLDDARRQINRRRGKTTK